MAMFIKVAKLNDKTQELFLEEGATVGDALRRAEFTQDGCDMSVYGRPVTSDDRLHEDDVLILVPRIKAGFFA